MNIMEAGLTAALGLLYCVSESLLLQSRPCQADSLSPFLQRHIQPKLHECVQNSRWNTFILEHINSVHDLTVHIFVLSFRPSVPCQFKITYVPMYVCTIPRAGATRPLQLINLLKPTGHVMHQQFNIQQLYVLPTLYSCVLYLSENKQRLVPLTA